MRAKGARPHSVGFLDALTSTEPTTNKASGVAVVALVAASAAVAQSFGRFAFGVVLPAVRDDLGISNTVAGLIATLNVAAYLIGTMAVAALTSKLRLQSVMRIGLMFSVTGLVLASVSPGPVLLGIAMFLAGFGGACIWIPAPAIAADAMRPEQRAMAIGFVASGMGIGIVFSGQIAAWARSSMGDEGWRTVYAILASIAVVVSIAVFLLIDHRQDQKSSGGGVGGFSALKQMRGWLPLTVAYTCFGFMYLLILAFLTTRLEDDNGWTTSRASLAFTLIGVALIFGGPLSVAMVNRVGARAVLVGAFSIWSVIALALLPGWPIPTYVLAILIGILFSTIPSTITVYVVQNTSINNYGPAFSAATLAFGVAQMVSPQIGGLVADAAGSFALVFVLSSVVAGLGAITALRLPKTPSDFMRDELPQR